MSLHLVESPTKPIPAAEPWVDMDALAAHLGYSYSTVRKMVMEGRIPSISRRNGSRTYYRFKISAVDAYLESHSDAQGEAPVESIAKP